MSNPAVTNPARRATASRRASRGARFRRAARVVLGVAAVAVLGDLAS